MDMSDKTWMNDVSLDEYSMDVRNAYIAYKEAYHKAAQARESFETLFSEATVEQGEKVLFSYRFGKLSIKVVEDDGKSARKAGKPKQSLADYLRERRESGLA